MDILAQNALKRAYGDNPPQLITNLFEQIGAHAPSIVTLTRNIVQAMRERRLGAGNTPFVMEAAQAIIDKGVRPDSINVADVTEYFVAFAQGVKFVSNRSNGEAYSPKRIYIAPNSRTGLASTGADYMPEFIVQQPPTMPKELIGTIEITHHSPANILLSKVSGVPFPMDYRGPSMSGVKINWEARAFSLGVEERYHAEQDRNPEIRQRLIKEIETLFADTRGTRGEWEDIFQKVLEDDATKIIQIALADYQSRPRQGTVPRPS